MWPWRRRESPAERAALLDALALDEVDEYRAAIHRIVGVAPMAPAQPMDAQMPPNAPDWVGKATRWPTNRPADSRLDNPPDNRRRW